MNNDKYCLITVLDTVSETSMPLNEFVLYRLKKYPYVKQYIIVCDRDENTKMCLPDKLGVYYTNGNSKLIKNFMKQISDECKMSNLKMIVHLHQIKAAISFYKSMFGDRKNYRVLFSVHSVYALRNKKYKLSSTLCALLSDQTICVSESSYKTYSPLAKLIKRKKISAIQNGVDIERIDKVISDAENTYNDTNLKKSVKTLVYVGRLIPIKNQKFLVEIFEQFSDCKLVFVGAEDKNKEISTLIQKLKLEDRIQITGMIPRNEVFRILVNADIYISSSTVEGLPVSVLEAMIAGLPVVLSDIEPHREIGIKSEYIKILSLSDEGEWIESINNYLKLDREELKKIGNKCRECAIKYFSLSEMHYKYDQVYTTLLDK